ncbi:MAG: thioredoxin family protein [Actinomycetota bacterium]|nr:thioredoxin family protein [Acidimicrobiales bacterium]MEC7778784.1 thioredoxin family protein [Actinomycetota bacterium]
MVADVGSAGLSDGLVAVVKAECPACALVAPVLADLSERAGLTAYTQDDATFPAVADWVVDDTDLAISWHLDLEAVPTLLRIEAGREVERTTGWDRDRWEQLTGVADLGPDLPAFKPG